MVSKNLILQRSDDSYSLSEYKKASEGLLHPRPKGQGIRDPLRSHSNKIEFVCEKFDAHGVIEQGLGFMIKRKTDGKILFNARTTKEGYAGVTGTFYAGSKKIYVTDEVLRINDEAQENVNFDSAHGNIFQG
jgi:hypothetical protein